MEEEKTEPQTTGSQPRQGQNPQGPRRNDRRDRGRHQGGQRFHPRGDQPQRPAQETPKAVPEKEADTDDEETEQDRSAASQHHHRRGGKPPKKIIEEWANDPYCE
ncbi:hypothetical protein [Methanoregula sp.]|uniref:hypothetical protein n=1 Tax=Methanoregula sp. TaxID=2052170 RepID=UPI0035670947